MKARKENTTRFKETILLLSFLILLFSFSNKSFGLSKKNEEPRSKTNFLIREVNAIVSGKSSLNFSFEKQTSSSKDLQVSFTVFNSKQESKKIISKIKHTLHIKPPNRSRLYYLFFSLSEHDHPPLA